MRALLTLALCLATACGGSGSADIVDQLEGMDFEGRLTVFHGGRHIVIIDRPFECRDIGWLRRNYFSAQTPATSSIPFAALQFTFDGFEAEINEGTFGLEGSGGPATGWLLDNLELPASGSPPPLSAERARTASLLTIDRSSSDRVEGSFEVFFGNGAATGTFRSVHCRNLRPN